MTSTSRREVIIGTRRSQLARWQTDHIVSRLTERWPELICTVETFSTEGDQSGDVPLQRIGGRGVFTSRLEGALRGGDIDIAVHSLKDLPTEEDAELIVAAITSREDVRDCLVARNGLDLAGLPAGACIGTSSTRREAQLRAIRPDLEYRTIRGNVETRIRKVMDGEYDATILAAAGLHRLDLKKHVTEYLDPYVMVPAPGQGALAVQCRSGDDDIITLLRGIDDASTREAVLAERSFLEHLGGGCSLPVGAIAGRDGDSLRMSAIVVAPDGSRCVRVEGTGSSGRKLGEELASEAVANGAVALLESVRDLSALKDRRVVVTRAAHQARYFAERLASLGAEAIIAPAIAVEPVVNDEVRDVLANIAEFDWIVFTSVNGVSCFVDAMSRTTTEIPSTIGIAAVGPSTASALKDAGLPPDVVPERFVGEELVAALGNVDGKRVLLPRADIARRDAADMLRNSGAEVRDLTVYRTVAATLASDLVDQLRKGADAIAFASGSQVVHFISAATASGVDFILDDATIACIGPVTAAAAEKAGLRVDVVAERYTIDGLIDALAERFNADDSNTPAP
jgi:hydroxymethylbilane synthase